MRERCLIINADDFGMSAQTSDAIADCHVNGVVTSTTLMTNMPGAEYAAKLARDLPELGIGVHVNLTEGEPVSPPDRIPALLDRSGRFPGTDAQTRALWRHEEHFEQVCVEISAQVQRCRDLGIEPTHCDSHHGIHKLPIVRRALTLVLLETGIRRARTPLSRHRLKPGAPLWAVPDYLKKNLRRGPSIAMHVWSHFQLRRAGIRTPEWKATRDMGLPCGADPVSELLSCIQAAPPGFSEILLHPGAHGPDESPAAGWERIRAEDTAICKDPRVRQLIEDSGIRLASFRDL